MNVNETPGPIDYYGRINLIKFNKFVSHPPAPWLRSSRDDSCHSTIKRHYHLHWLCRAKVINLHARTCFIAHCHKVPQPVIFLKSPSTHSASHLVGVFVVYNIRTNHRSAQLSIKWRCACVVCNGIALSLLLENAITTVLATANRTWPNKQ